MMTNSVSTSPIAVVVIQGIYINISYENLLDDRNSKSRTPPMIRAHLTSTMLVSWGRYDLFRWTADRDCDATQ
jgi:hypothetical protein